MLPSCCAVVDYLSDSPAWRRPSKKCSASSGRLKEIMRACVPSIVQVGSIRRTSADSIEAARNSLSMAWIDEEHCAQGIRCLDDYCKEWNEKHGTYRSQPVHNWASHGSDALQTGACGFVPEYIPPLNDKCYRKPRLASAWAA